MKTLAQLITELQAIPEPEKVVVIVYSGDGQFYFDSVHCPTEEVTNFNFLSPHQIEEMKEAGFTRAISL